MEFSHLYSSALNRELGTDDSTRLFTTDRRKDAINEGQLQFAVLTECHVRDSAIQCSNSVQEYRFSSAAMSTNGQSEGDFLRLAQVEPEYRLVSSGSTASTQFIAGDGFRLRHVNWFNQNQPGWRASTGGTPEAYYLFPHKIGLVPPPQIGSSEHGRLHFSYVSKGVPMTSDTDMPFALQGDPGRFLLEPYHQALVHYAAGQLEKLRKDWQAVGVQQQLFQSFVDRYRRESQPKGLRTVRTARNYFTEARQRRGGAGWPSWWVGR